VEDSSHSLAPAGAEEGSTTMEKLLVSILDAATALSVGRTTIYELMRSGQLETRKMGRRRLITAESLRRLVEKQD
jgi:excisionase family DNA binding protein